MPRRTSFDASARECAASASSAVEPDINPLISFAMAMMTLAASATRIVRALSFLSILFSAARDRRFVGGSMNASPVHPILCNLRIGVLVVGDCDPAHVCAPAAADNPSEMKALLLAITLANPILFVTQVPVPGDFTTVASTFGNHLPSVAEAPRGGDLWIRYADGTMKNLTRTAGFGNGGMQGAASIAVREPSVHWSGTKALFSMVIGAPSQQYLWETYYWQIYEVTGLGQNETPVIRKIANQPANYNNVSPFYGTDDRILFTSDRPRGGEAHLYPQLDEYEEAPTVTGLWSLDPATGDLRLLNHTPSGLFSPSIDSFGRVIFTRWDHLQRDQQADSDAGGGTYGTFDYADESANAARLDQRVEVFPEPRSARTDLLAGT